MKKTTSDDISVHQSSEDELSKNKFIIRGVFRENIEEIEVLVRKFMSVYGAKEAEVYDCLMGLMFDGVYDEWRSKFSDMQEEFTFLVRLERKLKKTISQHPPPYPRPFPQEFWAWHKEVVSCLQSDIKLTQKLMGSKKRKAGRRSLKGRDAALMKLMKHLKTNNVSDMISDVAKLGQLTGVFKTDENANPIETLRKIYYKTKR